MAWTVASVISPTGVASAMVVERVLRRWPDRLGVATGAVVTGPAAVAVWAGSDYAGRWVALVSALLRREAVTPGMWVPLMLAGVAMGPTAGALLWLVRQWRRERDPLLGQSWRSRREAVEAARTRVVVHRVQAQAHGAQRWVARQVAVPDRHRSGDVVLGRMLRGTLRWGWGRPGSLVVMPPAGRDPHMVVLGRTGAGKSEVAWRVLAAAARSSEQVVYINCKEPGSRAGSVAARLEDIAARHGRSVQALSPESVWDPMRGTPDQVRSRLLSTQVFSDEYYEHVSGVLVALALDLAAERGDPVGSIGDLAMMLADGRMDDLVRASAHREAATALLGVLGQSEVKGAVTRWAATAISMRRWIGPGWGWEDADLTAVDLPSSTEQVAARALLRAMLADLETYLTGSRRRKGRMVLVLDDIGAIDRDPVIMRRVVNLMERARSAGCRVVLIGQGPGSLGDEMTQEAALTNATVISGGQTDPAVVERLTRMAGTAWGVESSASWDTGGRREAGSSRAQHQWSMDPAILRGLRIGEVVVMSRGQWAQVAVAMTSDAWPAPTTTPRSRPALPARRVVRAIGR